MVIIISKQWKFSCWGNMGNLYKKLLLIAGLSSLGLSNPVSAADLPTPAPNYMKAPPEPAQFSWTGCVGPIGPQLSAAAFLDDFVCADTGGETKRTAIANAKLFSQGQMR
jgi:hypothetical protein